jgi:hypothetical protein
LKGKPALVTYLRYGTVKVYLDIRYISAIVPVIKALKLNEKSTLIICYNSYRNSSKRAAFREVVSLKESDTGIGTAGDCN